MSAYSSRPPLREPIVIAQKESNSKYINMYPKNVEKEKQYKLPHLAFLGIDIGAQAAVWGIASLLAVSLMPFTAGSSVPIAEGAVAAASAAKLSATAVNIGITSFRIAGEVGVSLGLDAWQGNLFTKNGKPTWNFFLDIIPAFGAEGLQQVTNLARKGKALKEITNMVDEIIKEVVKVSKPGWKKVVKKVSKDDLVKYLKSKEFQKIMNFNPLDKIGKQNIKDPKQLVEFAHKYNADMLAEGIMDTGKLATVEGTHGIMQGIASGYNYNRIKGSLMDFFGNPFVNRMVNDGRIDAFIAVIQKSQYKLYAKRIRDYWKNLLKRLPKNNAMGKLYKIQNDMVGGGKKYLNEIFDIGMEEFSTTFLKTGSNNLKYYLVKLRSYTKWIRVINPFILFRKLAVGVKKLVTERFLWKVKEKYWVEIGGKLVLDENLKILTNAMKKSIRQEEKILHKLGLSIDKANLARKQYSRQGFEIFMRKKIRATNNSGSVTAFLPYTKTKEIKVARNKYGELSVFALDTSRQGKTVRNTRKIYGYDKTKNVIYKKAESKVNQFGLPYYTNQKYNWYNKFQEVKENIVTWAKEKSLGKFTKDPEKLADIRAQIPVKSRWIAWYIIKRDFIVPNTVQLKIGFIPNKTGNKPAIITAPLDEETFVEWVTGCPTYGGSYGKMYLARFAYGRDWAEWISAKIARGTSKIPVALSQFAWLGVRLYRDVSGGVRVFNKFKKGTYFTNISSSFTKSFTTKLTREVASEFGGRYYSQILATNINNVLDNKAWTLETTFKGVQGQIGRRVAVYIKRVRRSHVTTDNNIFSRRRNNKKSGIQKF